MRPTPPPLPRRQACLALAASLLPAARAAGAVRRVAPGGLAQAVRQARDGDTLELEAGAYRGEVAVLTQSGLTLRGLGEGAVLHADGQHAEGKAVLVVRGDVRLENLAFSGSRVPDGNGAGVRFDRGRLRALRCRFIDNEMGLLTGNDPASQLELVDCHFAAAPRHAGALHHLLYIGAIASALVRGCRFEGGWRGHLLKSRARRNWVLGNGLVDGAGGEASYEIDFPDGGDNLVAGNLIVQSPGTQNPVLVSMGAEARGTFGGRLRLLNNTLDGGDAPGAQWLAWWPDRLARGSTIWARNNLLVGAGRWDIDADADGGGNHRVARAGLDRDLRPPATALLRALPLPADDPPLWAFTPPLGARPLAAPRWPGALQPGP